VTRTDDEMTRTTNPEHRSAPALGRLRRRKPTGPRPARESRAVRPRHPVPLRGAFTLVELLVVIGIIAVLVGILLPVLGRAQVQARGVMCQSNLRQIYAATVMYANDFKDLFPDADATGNFSFRLPPGARTPTDPGAQPEKFGLAALLDSYGYLSGTSGVWVCKSQPDAMQEYGNTYAFSISASLKRYTSKDRRRELELWVWDNFTLKPGLSGFRGPFSGYTIPTAERQYPHQIGKNRKTVNDLYLDGHVAPRDLR
jgi:prepilin-type N-terminal cleavage/methylation domain-containing protein